MTDRHTTNTTPALTPEREAEIRARLGAAWRGPWAVQGCSGAAFLEIGTPNGPIAQVSVHLKHDAEFIADARQAVPELLAELDRVRAERDGRKAKQAEYAATVAHQAKELAEARERWTAGLRHADEQVREMNAELKRYADGDEQPVLWSVYNAMHKRASTAEARVAELEQQAAEQRGELDTARAEIAIYEEQRDALFRLGRLMRDGQRWDGDRLVSERRLGLPEIRAALGWDEPRPDRPLLTEDAARPTL